MLNVLRTNLRIRHELQVEHSCDDDNSNIEKTFEVYLVTDWQISLYH